MYQSLNWNPPLIIGAKQNNFSSHSHLDEGADELELAQGVFVLRSQVLVDLFLDGNVKYSADSPNPSSGQGSRRVKSAE